MATTLSKDRGVAATPAGGGPTSPPEWEVSAIDAATHKATESAALASERAALFGGVPGKLDTSYSPVGLWNFDGDLVDSGSAGEDLVIARGAEHSVQTDADVNALYMTTADGLDGDTATAPAALRVTGDVTVQVVYTPIIEEIGSFRNATVWVLRRQRLDVSRERAVYAAFREHGRQTRTDVEIRARYEHPCYCQSKSRTLPYAWRAGAHRRSSI